MTLYVNHNFNSSLMDDPDAAAAGKITPSRWNQNHILQVEQKCLLGQLSSDFGGAVAEVPLGPGMLFRAGQLQTKQPNGVLLANNTVATTETIVARCTLPVDTYLDQSGNLAVGGSYRLSFFGTVSGTATLTFRVRLGVYATTTGDVALMQFTTSAAGVANGHVWGDILLFQNAYNTIIGTGSVRFGNAVLGPVAAVPAAATMDGVNALFASVTLVQSAAQTYTSRGAALQKMT